MMAIIGFIFLLCGSVGALLSSFGMFAAISAFGGQGSDKVAAGILMIIAIGGIYLACINAPFTISFT